MASLLSDNQIREYKEKGELKIEPFSGSLEPASYDLRVGDRVLSLTRGFEKELKENEPITIHPGELILIESLERVGLSKALQGHICSKVNLLAQGLTSISTKIDPGYGYPEGWPLLLVFHHCGHEPLEIRFGMSICSFEIEKLDKPASQPYARKEPKTVLLRPSEFVDLLAKQKLNFKTLTESDVEKFYNHPISDLILAVKELQQRSDKIERGLPKPRPLWQTAIFVYFLYFLVCGEVLILQKVYQLGITIPHLLTVFGILGGIIGVVLGLYQRSKK